MILSSKKVIVLNLLCTVRGAIQKRDHQKIYKTGASNKAKRLIKSDKLYYRKV